MRCEDVRPLVSAIADDEAERTDELTRHVAGCPGCRHFEARILAVRQGLRLAPVGEVPDVASRVVPQLGTAMRRRDRRPAWLAAAAAFAAGLTVAGIVVGVRPGDGDVAAADVPGQVLAAQTSIETLAADVAVVERGWHPSVGERRFTGRLRYDAPESLDLALSDRTEYPPGPWVRNDVTVVVDEDRAWTRGPRTCPAALQPGCSPRDPRVETVAGREPFSGESPSGLDFVVPVESFRFSAPPAFLGRRDVGGRTAIGVEVTGAQVTPLLGVLHSAGNLRAVHPTDSVDVWLDSEAMVPLGVTVTAASGPDRARWASARGYGDRPGMVILEVRLAGVAVNSPTPDGSFPPPPGTGRVVDHGFVDGDDGHRPLIGEAGPPGFLPYRSGTAQVGGGPRVEVRTWVDGRAWVKVRATDEWSGQRLFGDVGSVVREVALDGVGVVYVAEGGDRIGVHGDGVDVMVTGSVGLDTMASLLREFGLRGRPVPESWPESATADLARALAAHPELLVLADPEGFADPAMRVDGDTVTAVYAGPGSRAFVVVQGPGSRLSPPIDPDTRGVRLRGTTARFSPSRGELEWVERGSVVSVRSATMPIGELVALAERLQASP